MAWQTELQSSFLDAAARVGIFSGWTVGRFAAETGINDAGQNE